jgi:hypothetical protein
MGELLGVADCVIASPSLGCHSLEKVTHTDLFARINPLAHRVDFRIGLDCSNDCGSSDFDISSLFDNSFKRCANVRSSFVKEKESMCMSINGRPICQSLFGGNGGRAAPGDKVGFDLISLRMSANRTVSAMSTDAHTLCFSSMANVSCWSRF